LKFICNTSNWWSNFKVRGQGYWERKFDIVVGLYLYTSCQPNTEMMQN